MFLCCLCMHWVLWWGWSLHWEEQISGAVCHLQSIFSACTHQGLFNKSVNVLFYVCSQQVLFSWSVLFYVCSQQVLFNQHFMSVHSKYSSTGLFYSISLFYFMSVHSKYLSINQHFVSVHCKYSSLNQCSVYRKYSSINQCFILCL